MKILVIAPHPDDEVLGCGGTIAKHVENGDEVSLCIVTKAYRPEWSEKFLKNRLNEIKDSNKVLEIEKTYFLNFPTVKLDTIPQKEINQAISNVVKKVNPEIVYLPFKGDLNRDHRIIFESSLVAVRPLNNSIKKVLAYEILSETEWGSPIAVFVPTIYIDVSQFLEVKISAMKSYRSEIRDYPHPRSIEAMKALAIKRGSESGLKAAEAFMLIREVVVGNEKI